MLKIHQYSREALAVNGGEIGRILKNTVEKEVVFKFMYKEKQIIIGLQSLSAVNGLRLETTYRLPYSCINCN